MENERVWLIRAGSRGEAEPACFEQGICGVGWPLMPSLAGMSPEEISEEVDLVYAGEPEGRVRSYRRQLRDFMAFERGDLVVLPLKTDRRLVAVGRVMGGYEHRPELGDLLSHVRGVEWLTTSLARQAFERVMGSLNQPTTIGRLPVSPGQLIRAIDLGEPL